MRKILESFSTLGFIVWCLLSMALTSRVMGQMYSVSAPVSGWSEVDLSFGAGSDGGMVTTFGSLNETLYYDPLAQTLRQVGSVTLAPSSGSFSLQWFAWPYSSPAPTGAANLSIGDGTGILAFDSGTQNASPGTSQYFWNLTLPVSGSCAVVNNGQTNSETVSYSVNLDLMTTIVSASPSNLLISQSNFGGADPASEVANIGGTSLYNGTEDNTYHYSWKLDSISAVPAPEPGSAGILGLGAAMLAFATKAKSRKQKCNR